MFELVENEVVKENTQESLINVDRLPSDFIGYPQGTKIGFKPLSLGELEALNTDIADINRGIAFLLKSIVCNTMKVEDLYYWDVMYIGIQRKLLAFGDMEGTVYKYCKECKNLISHTFKYTDLEFIPLEVPDLPAVVTISGKEVEFGLLTIRDFIELDVEKGSIGVYARMIKNMSYEEALNLLENCTGKDIKIIKYLDKKFNYGLNPMETICSNCKTMNSMEVRSPFEVVFPEDTIEGSNEIEIRFGRE